MLIKNQSSFRYNEIISKAKSENRISGTILYEDHHIIPDALGGTRSKENMVLLTPEEHYECHSLLPDFCEGKAKIQMLYAWVMMNGIRILTHESIDALEVIGAEKYSQLKKDFSKASSGKNNHKSKEVYQLDKNSGKIIKKWDCVSDAVRALGIHISGISNRAKSGNAIAAGEFCWAYEDNLKEVQEKVIQRPKSYTGADHHNSKEIYQLDKDTGNIIKLWISAAVAAKDLECCPTGITNCARGTSKTSHGSKWVYEKDYENKKD